MKIPRYLQSAAGIFQLCLFLLAVYLIWLEGAAASQVSSNIIAKPSLLKVLAGVLNQKALIQQGPQSPKAKAHSFVEKQKRINSQKSVPYNMKHSRTRSDLLRQELAKETQDNCLAKLLCGADPVPAGSQKPNLIGDFGLLVKDFFDIFDISDDPPDDKKSEKDKATEKDDEEKKSNDDDDDEEEDDTGGRSQIVNISASVSNFGMVGAVTTSTSATVSEVTTGASMSEIPGLIASKGNSDEKTTEIHKMTLEELIGDMPLTAADFDRLRTSRALLSAVEPKQSIYIRRKLRELSLASTERKKLKIARQIATSMREPKQCRQFQNVASEILSTCPLTSEVVKYFNSNLRNGSQIAIITNSANASTGGLVLLNDQNDRPHAHFLDNNPIVANTRIPTDIKNPTVPERYPLEYQVYENTFPQIKNIKNVSLKKAPEKEDDGDSDENENDDDDDNEDEDEDDEDTNDDDDQNDIDDDYSSRQSPTSKKNKPKKPAAPLTPPVPTGIIKVYGVAQPSFDSEFSQISSQIGSGPVVIFDQDDFDANDPHPGPPVRPSRPRPAKVNANSRKRSQPVTSYQDNQFQSDEDSDENEDEYEDGKNIYRSNSPAGPPPAYMTHSYGGPPGPPMDEYYRHGLPPRPRPRAYRTVGEPIDISPESSVRGRNNFMHNPISRGGGMFPSYFG